MYFYFNQEKHLKRSIPDVTNISVINIPVVGDATNIILDPILMFVCHMGVTGAAVAHVISQ
jgi:Na+-driven multidrug efflux pump